MVYCNQLELRAIFIIGTQENKINSGMRDISFMEVK